MKLTTEMVELVGNTPLFALRRLFPNSPCQVLAKLEMFNPMSVKDRPVKYIIEKALAEGTIGPGTELVEASSGNTAIAMAMIGATKNMPVRIFMSELCSVERMQILNAFGAKVVLTPGVEHTKGARARAITYCEARPESTFFLNQHSNPANGDAHYHVTGPEVWNQTGGDLAAVVIGLGTAGTFEGLSRYFNEKDPSIRIIAFEPAASPVYSGGEMAKHRLVGIGPGFVTDNYKRGRERADELLHVSDDDAFAMTRRLARSEGILAGVTSGAALCVVESLMQRAEYAGKNILCLIYDSGERYLSVDGLFPADNIERMD